MSINLTTTYNGAIPASGPMVINVNAEVSATAELIIDLKLQNIQGQMSGVQTVFIDLSNYTTDLVLTTLDTNQRIVAKAGTQGYYPILSTNLMKYSAKGNSVGVVPLFFLNFPVAVGVW